MQRILTVTSAASSYALTTLAAVRGDLGEAAAGVADADLQKMIDDASDAIAGFCCRVLARESVTETFRRTGSRAPDALGLARAPVSAIASVTEDGVALTGSDYQVDPESGILYRLSGGLPSWWTASVTVVAYTGGWILPGNAGANLPGVLERACRQVVATMFHGRGRDASVRSESSFDVGSTSWLDPQAAHKGLPAGVAGLVGRYVVGGL